MGRWSSLLLAVLAAAVSACGGPASSSAGDGSGVAVLATTSVVGDIVANVVGDAGSVQVLVPRGADPHGFAPSAAQVAALTEADLVVANGLGLEEGLADTLASVREAGTPVFELASAYTRVIRDADGSDAADEHADGDDTAGAGADGQHDHTGTDPHIWFDPQQMADAVLALGAQLAAVDDSLSDGQWRMRARTYHDRILDVDRQVTAILAEVPHQRRKLVTNHATLAYFAQRYDFEVIGAAIPGRSPNTEPSAAQIAELVRIVRDAGVPAIFSEEGTSDRVLAAVAREVGHDVAVVPLLTGSLAPRGEDGDTYLSLLLTDAQRIAQALA